VVDLTEEKEIRKIQMDRVYGIANFGDDEFANLIAEKYKKDSHIYYAHQLAMILGEFTRNNPVEHGLSGKKNVQYRREYRKHCQEYLMTHAKEHIKPYGILGGFFFVTIISSIISFFVERLLKKYFGDE